MFNDELIKIEIKENRLQSMKNTEVLHISLEGILFCQMHDKGYITDEELWNKMNSIRKNYGLHLIPRK